MSPTPRRRSGRDGTIYMGDRDNSLNAYSSPVEPLSARPHAQVAVQPRARGRHLATPGHRPRGPPGGGHHLLHPRPDHRRGGHLHRPHRQRGVADGEVEVQDRQLRPAVLPGDRRERHHLLRRSERLSLRLRGQGRLYGQWHASHAAGADLLVHHRTQGGPVLLWRKQVGTTPASPRRPSSPRIRTRSTSARRAPSPAFPWASPRSTSPIRARAPCPAASGHVDVPDHGKVDQTPALGRDGTLYVPAMNGGQKRLYAVNARRNAEMA